MNITDYLVLNERNNPTKTAIRSSTDSWTYEELVSDVRRFANVLRDDEIDPDSRVAVMLPNTYDFAVAMFGMLAHRHLTGLIDPRIGQGELATLVNQIEPKAVVTTADRVDSLRSLDAELTIYTIDDQADTSPDFWDAITDASDDYRVPETLGDREALILHTSGSTGQPKAVVHTHDNFIAVSDLATISYELATDTTYLAALPLYHCWGLMNLGSVLKVGGEVVLMERWDANDAIERFDAAAVDFFAGVPTMYKDMIAAAPADWTPVSLELAITGGAGVPSELIPDAEALLECPTFNGWGMTETFAAGIWEEQSQSRRIPSVGTKDDRLFEAKIVDRDSGKTLPRGETGELLIRGDAVMNRYLSDPAGTDRAFEGDWFHTGDIAYIDQDGYVFLQEREKYMIITGGENIYPQEVEDVIEELDSVRHAVVVAKPDDRKGQKPVAFVECDNDEVTEEAIKSHCLDNLAAFKHPRSVTFIDQPPRNSVGKIQRSALEDRFPE